MYYAPLIRLRPWRYINLFTYLLTYMVLQTYSQSANVNLCIRLTDELKKPCTHEEVHAVYRALSGYIHQPVVAV